MNTPLLGICFTLEGLEGPDFARLLRDVTQDPAFARPLQLQAREPGSGAAGAPLPGQITVAFAEADRTKALAAMQRFKTLMLRYGVQVDDVRVPG